MTVAAGPPSGTLPMKPSLFTRLCTFVWFSTATTALVTAQQPITLNEVEENLPEITADEPHAVFSASKAAEYLDRPALNCQKTKNCATCQTNLSYMVARPRLRPIFSAPGEVPPFSEDSPKVRWEPKKPRE